MSLRGKIVRLLRPALRRAYLFWNAKPRHTRKNGLALTVLPGVFHPGLFFSTELLAEHVSHMELQGKRFLELGAGAGLISLIAARNGAHVTASDINPQAVANVKLNAERNGLKLVAVLSDLFTALPQHFDVIAINPPYYPKEPKNAAEKAFFAGSGHDYFVRLFPELPERLRQGSQVYMVLSGDLDRKPIETLASEHGLRFTEVRRKLFLGEAQVVFVLTLV